jgi:hypothetical protein
MVRPLARRQRDATNLRLARDAPFGILHSLFKIVVLLALPPSHGSRL